MKNENKNKMKKRKTGINTTNKEVRAKYKSVEKKKRTMLKLLAERKKKNLQIKS